MTAPDERVWLTHPEHGGYFHCPAAAVEIWTGDLGWVIAEGPPEEPNPVIAESLAWRAEQEQAAKEQQKAEAAERRAEKKAAREADDEPPSRSKTWSKSDTTEGD